MINKKSENKKTMEVYTKMLGEAMRDGTFESGDVLVYKYLASVMMLEVYEESLRKMGCTASDIEMASTTAIDQVREMIAASKGMYYSSKKEEA
jgi:hypothetical protein